MIITPTRGKILITNLEETQPKDKLILAVKTKKEIPMSGVVLAIGAPITLRDKKVAFNAKKGDVVYFQRWSGKNAKKHLDSNFKIFLRFSDVIAVRRM